jgi:hypothetical protein
MEYNLSISSLSKLRKVLNEILALQVAINSSLTTVFKPTNKNYNPNSTIRGSVEVEYL